uniref:DUF6465 family protein n=1 Tax=Agathobacter sp. TaxID=2021311 RepID=UPI004057CB19
MAAKKTVKAEEVKVEENVTAEAPAAEAAPAEEKAAKKTTRKACATKKTAKKAEKAEKTTEIVLQFQGSEATAASIEEKVKAKFVEEGHRAGNIKTLTIYVKPEEAAAYYVINENYTGRVDLF